MIELKASNVIQQMTDQFLDRKTPAEYDQDYRLCTAHGVVFELTANLTSYDETLDDDGDVMHLTFEDSTQLYLLFTGGTSVFVAEAPRGNRWISWTEVPLDSWKNTSNHDSCWRSDGVDSPLSAVYFSMADEVNRQREQSGLERVAPATMHQFSNLGRVLGKLFTELQVTTEPDPEGGNPGYHRKITQLVRKDNS